MNTFGILLTMLGLVYFSEEFIDNANYVFNYDMNVKWLYYH